MGMSTYAYGYRNPDDNTYQKHLRILRVCQEEGISLPVETNDFFGDINPICLNGDEPLRVEIPVHESTLRSSVGYEVILSELPPGIHKIRFENSW
jgi:hypothetical protein